MTRRRPAPLQLAAAATPPPPDPLDVRRARAFLRAWPLLATTIPTADIVAAYLDDVIPGT